MRMSNRELEKIKLVQIENGLITIACMMYDAEEKAEDTCTVFWRKGSFHHGDAELLFGQIHHAALLPYQIS